MIEPGRRRSREELFAEIERARSYVGDGEAKMDALLHELRVHQEELNAQNTQLVEARNLLEEARDRYADLYDSAPIGYLTLDQQGIIAEINLTGAALIVRRRETILGFPLSQFLQPDDRPRLFALLARCHEERQEHWPATEVTMDSAIGRRRLELLCRPRVGSAGRLTFLIAMVDITERTRLEAERRMAEEERERLVRAQVIVKGSSEEAKDRFLATLSHELRTPLNPVLAALTDSLFLRDVPPLLAETLAMMRRNIELEVHLIDDLLDMTRISRDRLVIHPEPADVHAAVREVLTMVAHQIGARGLEVEIDLQAQAPWVKGDATRLRQVLWNLLSNAIKFTPAGGRVTISTANTSDRALTVVVADTGAGMDPELVQRLSTSSKDGRPQPMPSDTGLGLGLAICRGVVEAHGGALRPSSAGRGKGSTFTVVLPDAHAGEEHRAPAPVSAVSHSAKPQTRILLVEDDEDSVAMLGQLLTLHGYRVDTARSIADAMKAAGGVDLVISDLQLPDGSGLDLMRQLTTQRPGVRGIVLSGFGSTEDVRRSAAAGYVTHLTKPVDMAKLLEAIERFSARPLTNRASARRGA
jgi:PAS domain S-box-containing protein